MQPLEPRLLLAADVVISEIMHHPLDPASPGSAALGQEYVELFNRGNSAATMGGWRFSAGVSYTFPAGTTLGAGQYLVVAADVGAFQAKYPGITNVIGGWTGRLSNSRESVTLRDANDVTVDTVAYADQGDWAVRSRSVGSLVARSLTRSGTTATVYAPGHGVSSGDQVRVRGADQEEYNGTFTVTGATPAGFSYAISSAAPAAATGIILVDHLQHHSHKGYSWYAAHDGLGSSLELVNPALANNHGQNWASSVLHGTPGTPNSVATDDLAPMILDLSQDVAVPTSSQAVTVRVRLLDESPASALSATLHWRVDAATPPAFASVAMHDDGLAGDAVAGDGLFAATIPPQANNAVVEFYVTATDGAKTRAWPAPTDDAANPQRANLLYQVDDTAYTGGQPVFKFILTEKERAELAAISNASDGGPSGEHLTDAQMNATLIRIDGAGTRVVHNVGIRNRGKGSRDDNPPNFHVNIPTDRTLNHVSAYNFNGRCSALEVMGSALHRLAGLPAQDAVAGQLRINNVNLALGGNPSQMYGSYAVLEALNTEWVDNHFPLDSSGNFYRGFSSLTYLGANKESYRASGTDSGYEKKTNTEDDDWSDLIALTRALDAAQTPDAQYAAAVRAVADVEQWMRYFALSELIGNRENSLPTADGDDYSMYRGMDDPRFRLIVHDLDTILGLGDSAGGETDPIFRAGNNPQSGKSNARISRFLKFPEFAPIYFAQLKELATTALAAGNVNPVIDSVGAYLPPSVTTSMKDFLAARAAHVLGLIPQALTVSAPSLTPLNGYPRTTGATADLQGTADAVRTRSVKVNGVTASYSPWEGKWSLAGVALRPGINRVLVQALDADGKEVGSTFLDVWRDGTTPTSVSGTISGNATWALANSPYRVTGNIVIASGATLTIEPGVTVFFDSGFSISAADGAAGQGRLVAVGTPGARIHFTHTPAATATRWGGFVFDYSTTRPTAQQADNRIAYADLEFGDSGSESIRLDKGRIEIDHVRWGNHTKQFVDATDASLVMTHSYVPGISSAELIHYWGFPSDGYARFVGNTFGYTTGYNDIIDFTGGQRPGPIVYFIDNTFLGGTDDAIDLDATDAHVEGNVFMNFHQNIVNESKSHAVSTGTEGGVLTEVTIVRNLFYDLDHAIIIKDGAIGTIVNNTFVKIYKNHADATTAAINLFEPRSGQWPGAGVYADGNIFHDVSRLFEFPANASYPTPPPIVMNNSIFPLGAADVVPFTGTGNVVNLDPQLVNTTNVMDLRADFALRPGPGPAVGTGPGGRDMGALVPSGAWIGGAPIGTTYRTGATLAIGGPEIYAYRWRLDGGPWSADVNALNPSQMNASVPPLVLSGLSNGTHTLEVIAKNSAGVWQDASQAASRTWTVDAGLAPRVRLSEVLASNVSAYSNGGTYADVIEITNDGATPLNLGGMSVTDNLASPRKYVFPAGTMLASGQRMLLFADNSNPAPGPHLGFSLKKEGEGVWIFDAPAAGGGLLDSVRFGSQLDDLSISRDDATGAWRLSTPTLGQPNAPLAMGDVHRLKINEWLASGVAPFEDDFVELHNPQDYPVDLGGLYLSDEPDGDPTRFQVTPLTFVAEHAQFTFVADDDVEAGADHASFKLAHEQGALGLFDAAGREIDRVLYGPQRTGISQGRSPDGAGAFASFAVPNPGTPNPHDGSQTVTRTDTVLNFTDVWRYFQTGAPPAQGSLTWKSEGYYDGSWPSGGGLLYAESSALPEPKTTPLTLTSGRMTYYFRSTFNLPVEPSTVTELVLQTVVDDGAVIYFNGQEAYRVGMDPNVTVIDSTPAARNPTNASRETWTLPQSAINLLRKGVNSIAVEVHQTDGTSTDVVWGGKLTATSSVTVTDPDAAPLRITEVNYNPVGGGGALLSSNDYEFIEVRNTGPETLNLSGLRFDAGVAFSFPNAALAPGAYGVIVKNPAAFAARYGAGINVLGTYSDSLDNGGELLRVVDANGLIVTQLAYSDRWQPSTDGDGRSLSVIDDLADAAAYGAPANWAASRFVLGSPGMAEPTAAALESIVVNEILSNSDAGGDWIELRNVSGGPVDISGWYLSDSASDAFKYRFPDAGQVAGGTVIEAGGFLVLHEFADFGNPANPAALSPFGVSQAGQALYLSAADAGAPGVLTGYRHRAVVGAADVNVTFGRHLVPSTGQVDFVALASATEGADNAGPAAPTVLLNELMYDPAGNHDEFIELRNVTGSVLPLYDVNHPDNAWRLTDGVEFIFPEGASIPAYGYALVVAVDPAAFRERYGIPNQVPIYGPYGLSLSDDGETVELARPVAPDPVDGSVAYVTVERVSYGVTAPWPAAPHGAGPSLARISGGYGNDPAAWSASPALGGTPGAANVAVGTPPFVSGLPATAVTGLGGTFSASGSVGDADPGQTLVATVDYGDGAGPQPLALGGDGSFTLSHAYDLAGPQQVVVGVFDSAGLSASQTVTLTVEPVIHGSAGETFRLRVDPGGTVVEVYRNTAPGSGVQPTYRLPIGAVTPLVFSGGSALVIAASELSAAGLALAADGAVLYLQPSSALLLASATISGGGEMRLDPAGTPVLRTPALSLAAGGLLDLADGALIVDGGDVAAIEALVRAARNGGTSGLWSGRGITTTADTAPGARGARNGLAVVSNDGGGGGQALRETFLGQEVGADDVLVAYTAEGDANLDFRIDAADYFRIDRGRSLGLTGYANGDFDYSGLPADADDYLLIDRSFMAQGAGQGASTPAPASTSSPTSARAFYAAPKPAEDAQGEDEDEAGPGVLDGEDPGDVLLG